jgi:hypothetical protein
MSGAHVLECQVMEKLSLVEMGVELLIAMMLET